MENLSRKQFKNLIFFFLDFLVKKIFYFEYCQNKISKSKYLMLIFTQKYKLR